VGGGGGGGGPSFRQTFQAEASSVEEMEGEESALHGLTQPRVQPIYAPIMDSRPLHTHYYYIQSIHTNISVFKLGMNARYRTAMKRATTCRPMFRIRHSN